MRQAWLNENRIDSATGRAIPLLAAFFALASCATPFDMYRERIAQPGPEWGVVIGSILVQPEMLAADKPATGRDASNVSYEFDIVQTQPADPGGTGPYAQRYRLNAKAWKERIFISRLRPGQYLIREFYEAGLVGLGGELTVVFMVEPGEIRYIGRLRVEIPRRVSSGNAYRFSVENAREATLAQISTQHAELARAPVDKPMQARLRAAP